MGLNHSPKIVMDSITGYFDAENPKLGTGQILDLTHQQPIGGNIIKITLTNTTYVSTTPKCYTFNGNTTTATIQSYPNFVGNSTTDYTIEIMLRPTNLTGERCILKDAFGDFDLTFNNNQISLNYYGDVTSFSSPSTLTTGNWYHIVFINASSSVSAYCNGIYQGTASIAIFQDIGSWRIGNGNYSADKFVGDFGFFRSYSKILSATEVLQNFNALRGRYGI